MLHVVLVAPEIPWNTGNAGRTCLAAQARLHLVRPLGFHLTDRWLRRAGLDYWEHVDPVVHDSLEAFEASEGPGNLYDMEIPDEAVFVFGSESTGLPPTLRERYKDRLTHLPILDPRARSLNLSTAVGITVYEALRRRR
jgi:tRNA (cytidine/uridine-2'-O-)-methyltransferase